MKKSNRSPKFFGVLMSAAIALSSITFTSCGSGAGGDGNGDGTPATTRPKTLEGVVLSVQGQPRFEFIRSFSSQGAALDGQSETGTFFYNLTGVQYILLSPINQAQQIGGAFPDQLSGGTYTYTALNSTSATLTLRGSANVAGTITGVPPLESVEAYFFIFGRDGTTNEVTFDITFTEQGNRVTVDTILARIGPNPLTQDRFLLSNSNVQLRTGSPVPPNYNPPLDPLRPSRIVPTALGGSLLDMDVAGGTAEDFTLQLTQTGAPSTGPNGTVSETGMAVQRVGPGGATIFSGASYTWSRIPGTDDGTLVISNGDPALNGEYRLAFASPLAGTFSGVRTGDFSRSGGITVTP